MKNTIGKTLIIALISLNSITAARAQKHEITIGGSGFFSGIEYNSEAKDLIQNKNSGAFSLNYNYKISKNWSFGIAGEYAHFSNRIIDKNYEDAYMVTDQDGDEFFFRIKALQFAENLTAGYLQIPVTVQFEYGKSTKIYVAAGMKYGIALKGKSTLNWRNLETSAYFEEWDAELQEPEFMGFGKWGSKWKSQSIDFKNNFSLTGEIGLKQHFTSNQVLYIGFYYDYGLTDIAGNYKNNSSKVLEYQTQGSEPLALFSNMQSSERGMEMVNLVSFGIKIKYGFGF